MKKPLVIENGIALYCKSMGKVFRVFEICNTDEEANEYCRKHKDAGVIATDSDGRVYLAELYGSICPSSLLKDTLQ